MMRRWYKKLICVAVVACATRLSAAPFDHLLNTGNVFSQIESAADAYEYVGDNVIATGHVVIRYENVMLTGQKAIFNLTSQDVELGGNVSFSVRKSETKLYTEEEYIAARRSPYQIVQRESTVTTEFGQKLIRCKVTKNSVYMNADKAFLNVKSGSIQFKNFQLKEGVLYASGEKAERHSDGTITVRDTKFTTCNYLMDGHDHYALSAKKAVIKPPRTNSGLLNYAADIGDVSVLALNSTLQLWGTPVLWLPAIYKAAEDGGFGGRIAIGSKTDWGFFVQMSKNFKVLDDPYLNANLFLDFYSKRGVGYGINMDFMTAESSTDLLFYGIYDKSPYEYWGYGDDDNVDWKASNSRLKIPHYRYEFKLSNITHITPRLDFRGQVDLISDFNYLRDYSRKRFLENMEPPTFLSFERQFDRFTASLYASYRVNSWSSTMERLPEIKLDFQRQKLFAGLYYQGETSLGYYRMRWREFDRDRTTWDYEDPKNYDAFRFDTLHMFYYPIKFWNLNLIPRAGFRLTTYSQTSKQDVSMEDFSTIVNADTADGQPTMGRTVNYDDKGGSQIRFIGEVGLELNTKFYRTWQDVKSEFFGLDGLRHVAIPYVNYTFIPKPTLSVDNVYYFDENDRIDEQHFIRLGLINRLQTRRDGSIYEWFSMENYWDYFFHTIDGFNNVGDLGTIIKFRPSKKLMFSTSLLLDVGKSNSHDAQVWRGDELAGRPGLDCDIFNRWTINGQWEFAPKWVLSAGYIYADKFYQRTPYSMGSSFAATTATSLFLSTYTRGQHFSASLAFPLFFDEHSNCYVGLDYDINEGLFDNVRFGYRRKFHCWALEAEVGGKTERTGEDYEKKTSMYFALFLSLSAMPGSKIGHRLEP